MVDLDSRDEGLVRVGILLAAWWAKNAPATDWGEEFTAGDAFRDILNELPDRLDEPEIESQLMFLLDQEV